MKEQQWKETLILVDADYVDKVAFDLTVNFERMLGRRISAADMARWLECVALDGGCRPADDGQQATAATQVVLLHSGNRLDNFMPGSFDELDGKAFTGALGEFLISCVKVEPLTSTEELFCESLQVVSTAPEVKRLIVVPNAENYYNKVSATLRHSDPDKHVTVLAMQPLEGGGCRQEILGYSLMAALGISAEEVGRSMK